METLIIQQGGLLMSSYLLSCEMPADLTREHFEQRNIFAVPFHFFLNDKEYIEDFGQTVPFSEFYKMIADGAMTRTSQPNISEYVAAFTPHLEKGMDIVHLCLSSGISGAYNSAKNASEILAERFPERKVYVSDTLAASSGMGLLADMAADKRDEGLDAKELAAWIEANKLRVHHWFFTTDLTTFVRGGRVSKAAGVFGGLLDICPLLNVDTAGRLTAREKIRTKKRVIRETVKKMEQFAENGTAYSGKCYISQSACYGDAREVADLIEERFPNLEGKVEINWVGNLIGSHTGPGTVALFFCSKGSRE